MTPRLSGLWLGLVTPAQARVGRAWWKACAIPPSCARPRRSDIRDSSDDAPRGLRARSTRAAPLSSRPTAARRRRRAARAGVRAIRRIGAATGWYFGDALWRLRGWIDGGLGGVGMPGPAGTESLCRRRHHRRLARRSLRAGSPAAFVGRAGVPGRGWLEFGSTRSTAARVRSSARRQRSTRGALPAASTGTP
jgi:hypothetical protein